MYTTMFQIAGKRADSYKNGGGILDLLKSKKKAWMKKGGSKKRHSKKGSKKHMGKSKSRSRTSKTGKMRKTGGAPWWM